MELHDVNQWLGFLIGAVLAMIVQGEGQSFFVLMFQVMSQREKAVYDLNPANHFDVRSIPLTLLAGWTWSRKRVVKPAYFPSSRICCSLVPLAGAFAVILLSGILGTFYAFMPGGTIQTAIEASAVIAVANLLVPIPPLALGRALCCPFENSVSHQSSIELVGVITLTGLVFMEYWMKWPLLQHWILTVSRPISKWVLGI